MSVNFDQMPNRFGTNAAKWDALEDKDFLPLWVADMDFYSPQEITQRLTEVAKRGTYGYNTLPEHYLDAVVNWEKTRHGISIEKDWLMYTCGVVAGISWVLYSLTQPGDKILIQTPVYTPFHSVITDSGRVLVDSPLVNNKGKYTIDFADFEAKIKKEQVKAFICCNPHNPVGRCWSKEELTEIYRICRENDVLIISDEIHQDLIRGGFVHTPMASVAQDAPQYVITLSAPSKTFNVPGLKHSFLFTSNEEYRKAIREKVVAPFHIGGTLMGYEACTVAYSQCAYWVDELNAYLDENARFVNQFMAENLPEVVVSPIEATYLMWLDFGQLGLRGEELSKVVHDAKIKLSDGTAYASYTDSFQRVNIGCPKSMLEEAMNRLKKAIDQYRGK